MNWIKVGWCGLALFACKTQEKSLSQTQLGERAYEQYLQNQAQSWEGKNLSQHRFKPLDGPLRSLKSYRGQVVLLNFWFSNCPPCVAEMPSLERLQSEYGAKGLQIISLSIDSEEKLRSFLKSYGKTIGYTLGMEAKALAEELGVQTYPTSFMLNKKGLVHKVFIGASDWDATYTYFTTKKDIEKLLAE